MNIILNHVQAHSVSNDSKSIIFIKTDRRYISNVDYCLLLCQISVFYIHTFILCLVIRFSIDS